MSAELIGILGVGATLLGAAIALAGLVLIQSRAIRSELRDAARERAGLRDRLSHLEGLLEGLLRRDIPALEPAK